MDQKLVGLKHWIHEQRFLHALNDYLTLLLIEQRIPFHPCSSLRPVQAVGRTRIGVMPTSTNLLYILGRSLSCHDVYAR
jgi:hypothetical protein